jgi:hypothetical protein
MALDAGTLLGSHEVLAPSGAGGLTRSPLQYGQIDGAVETRVLESRGHINDGAP